MLAYGADAPPPPKPVRLGLCAACHGENGIAALPAHPHLAGQDAEYLRQSLAKYRSGERQSPQMQAILGAVSAAEQEALVLWYASLPRDGGAAR